MHVKNDNKSLAFKIMQIKLINRIMLSLFPPKIGFSISMEILNSFKELYWIRFDSLTLNKRNSSESKIKRNLFYFPIKNVKSHIYFSFFPVLIKIFNCTFTLIHYISKISTSVENHFNLAKKGKYFRKTLFLLK